ncbi:MAG: homoserine O-succinyltransferase [Oscillospiraceae bacterium]|nr:homoserine O-succinyltransferase [Oscillospiraceae bacterium]
MPIKIPDKLPAHKTLENENVFVINEQRALCQDIRPLKILLLNLMPKKIETETQILRMLSNTPLQVEVELLKTSSHQSKTTAKEHLIQFYKTFDEIKNQKFDGMIITGAPIEHLEFNEVNYWDELCDIMKWGKNNVYSTFYICWGAQAGLYYHYGINRKLLDGKISGIFEHTVTDSHHPIVRGFDEVFYAPHSSHASVNKEQIVRSGSLKILAESNIAGVYIIADNAGRNFFVTGHSEYDLYTLKEEYLRDIQTGGANIPCNYFPNDDTNLSPVFNWRSHGYLLYSNWINYFVYQNTPYDLDKIGIS